MLKHQTKEEKIKLSEFITHVANEIKIARDASPGGDKVLDLSECEIEMALSVEGQAGGGIKVSVVELGGHLSKSNSSTVRLRFGAHGAVSFQVGQAGAGPNLGKNQGGD